MRVRAWRKKIVGGLGVRGFGRMRGKIISGGSRRKMGKIGSTENFTTLISYVKNNLGISHSMYISGCWFLFRQLG